MVDIMPQHADWARVALALAAVTVVAYVAASVAARLARAALAAIVRHESDAGPVGRAIHRPVRLIRAAVFVTTLLALGLPALELAGVTTSVGLTPQTLTLWLFGSGLRVLVIAILTYALLRIIAATARRLEEEMGQATSPDMIERLKRARTVSRLVQNALSGLVAGIAGLMILRELQVDIVPILTGAGIVGLAIGFGAQTLVKDLIAGFFLTLENQVRVGDVAVINGVAGLVEEINLRTLVLRDGEGSVHIFPNGSIERLSNRTKDYSYAVVDVGIPYAEDPDRVMEVLREVGASLAGDATLGPSVLEPVEVLGVDAFEETRMIVKARIKTLPQKQWDVGREYRRRVVKILDDRGIVMPVRPAVTQPGGREAAGS
jgi:small conductance mechanosensitive channel